MRILAVYCCGGLGKEVMDLAQSINKVEDKWDRFIFVDDNGAIEEINGSNVFTFQQVVELFKEDKVGFVIASGEPHIRRILQEKVEQAGYSLVNIIAKSVSHISDLTQFGKGIIVFPNCYIGPNVKIGDNCIIHANNTISHDSELGNHCMLCPSVSVSGTVKIGNEVFIGIGATIKDEIEIEDYAVVGIGSSVVNKLDERVIVMSSPARKIGLNTNNSVW
ncbi:acetyltransferase [Anaerosacchariphilus polymeriproducens]|nr:acetyltransferase [Anaerosacchariphilus polymeriproducens]